MIELPFPPPKLSPNSRCHWAQKARAFKSYKSTCAILIGAKRSAVLGRDSFSITFHPPTAHRYDLDNLVSRWKAGCDALSAVCGVDDSKFQLTIAKGEPVKGGAVIVRPA